VDFAVVFLFQGADAVTGVSLWLIRVVEALLHQVLQRDPAGDEGLEVHLALLHHPDHGGVLPDVGDGAAQVDFPAPP
jgi:hypothetical protein